MVVVMVPVELAFLHQHLRRERRRRRSTTCPSRNQTNWRERFKVGAEAEAVVTERWRRLRRRLPGRLARRRQVAAAAVAGGC